MAGLGLSFTTPSVLSKCLQNALNALTMRHLSAPPNRTTIVPDNFFLDAYPDYKRQFLNHYHEHLSKWKEGRTQAKLRSIDESILFDKVERNKAKSFIKTEVTAVPPKKARLIQGNQNDCTAYEQPDSYRAIAETLKGFAKQVFERAGIKFRLIYASGMNADALSAAFNDAIAESRHNLFDERDGRNWDATMQEPLLRREAEFYHHLDPKIAKAFLSRSALTRGKIRTPNGTLKYTTSWKRLSGDWNTSVGNSLVSMLIAVHALTHLPAALRPKRVTAFFLGDDYLGVYGYDVQVPPCVALSSALDDMESACGITPVRGVFTDPTRAEFISMTVWPKYDGTYYFVPKFTNMAAKLFWSIHPLSRHTASDVQATVQAFRPVFAGFTFMERFLSWHAKRFPTKRSLVAPSQFLKPYKQRLIEGCTAGVAWSEGFIRKFALPITILDFDLPLGNTAMWLEQPSMTHLFGLEHQDPDKRMNTRPGHL